MTARAATSSTASRSSCTYHSDKTERGMFAFNTDENHVFVRLDGEMMPKKVAGRLD